MPAVEAAVLKALLMEERRLLKTGALASLGHLADRKDALARRLAAVDGQSLRQLGPEFEENQRLIAAAFRGVQSARARFRDIVGADAGTSVYTAQGRLVKCGVAAEVIERRA